MTVHKAGGVRAKEQIQKTLDKYTRPQAHKQDRKRNRILKHNAKASRPPMKTHTTLNRLMHTREGRETDLGDGAEENAANGSTLLDADNSRRLDCVASPNISVICVNNKDSAQQLYKR